MYQNRQNCTKIDKIGQNWPICWSGFWLNISLDSYLPPGREKPPNAGGPGNIDGVPIDKLPDIIEEPQETTEHNEKEEQEESKSIEKSESTTFKFDDFTEGNSEEIGVEVTTENVIIDGPEESGSTILPNEGGGMYSGGNFLYYIVTFLCLKLEFLTSHQTEG